MKFETFLAYEIVQTAEIIEKNGLSFQDFWHYTVCKVMTQLYYFAKIQHKKVNEGCN